MLAAAPEVWLRTKRHPTVGGLPVGPRTSPSTRSTSANPRSMPSTQRSSQRVLELGSAARGRRVRCAGPSALRRATVGALAARASEAGLSIRVVAGVSFVDTIASALGVDPLTDGLLILDALSLGDGRRMLVPQRPTIIAQVYDRRAASQAKLALLDAYPPEHPVRIVAPRGTDERGVIETHAGAAGP